MSHGASKNPPASLGALYRCRKCRGSVCILGYGFVRNRGSENPVGILWAGAVCPTCGARRQYGHGGDASDYRHARFWCWGKEFEEFPGRVATAPAEFWEFIANEKHSRLHDPLPGEFRSAIH